MIEFVLAYADLGRIRFAHSPLRELVASLRTLHDPQRKVIYGRWLASVEGQLGHLDLDLLTALSPAGSHAWGFLNPVISGQWSELKDELEAVACTDAELVRRELELYSHDAAVPKPLKPLHEDPAGYLPVIAAELDAYWNAAIEPLWHQVQALTAADLMHRREQFAKAGLHGVLNPAAR